MRARELPGHENIECPSGFNYAVWHKRNWPKVKVFRPVITEKTLQTLLKSFFGTPECAPNQQQHERVNYITIWHSPSGGFSPISRESFFLNTKCVSKRTPTPFLVIVTLCNRTLGVSNCFPSVFATSVAKS